MKSPHFPLATINIACNSPTPKLPTFNSPKATHTIGHMVSQADVSASLMSMNRQKFLKIFTKHTQIIKSKSTSSTNTLFALSSPSSKTMKPNTISKGKLS